MTMRISTANSYDASLDALVRRQTALTDMQEQLSTTKRVNHASDDPAAAGRAERALASEKRADASQRAVDASKTAMTLSESALGDASDLMQQIREAMVASGNASYSDAERASLANQIQGLRDQLLSVANRTDGSGTHLFGGQGSDQAPFVDTTSGVQFRGVGGKVDAASGEPLPLTVDGDNAWMRARSGNGVFETRATVNNGNGWIDNGRVTDPQAVTGSTYSIQFSSAGGATTYSILQDGNPTAVAGAAFVPGRAIEFDGQSVTISGTPANGDEFTLAPSQPDLSVFDVLDRTVADLRTTSRSSGQKAQDNAHNLGALDAVMGQIQAARSAAGETLNRIDGVTGRLDAVRLASQTERENAEGLDMVKAISEFQNKQTGYDAALKSYALVQKISLFNYIS
jgi:flagellar hook-associated protein 3 FlgL